MPRRTFDSEFKIEIASLVLDQGLTIQQACEASETGPTAVRRWVKQLREERLGQVSKGTRPITAEQQKIAELEARIKRLEEDKEILKKATAFFVQDAQTRTRSSTR